MVCLFNNCIEKNQTQAHFEEDISYCLALIPPCIHATISITKNLQHNFPKIRGGSKAIWNFHLVDLATQLIHLATVLVHLAPLLVHLVTYLVYLATYLVHLAT